MTNLFLIAISGFDFEWEMRVMENKSFFIKVAENIGLLSKEMFGSPGKTIRVKNGELVGVDIKPQGKFNSVDEINDFFNNPTSLFRTKFEDAPSKEIKEKMSYQIDNLGEMLENTKKQIRRLDDINKII